MTSQRLARNSAMLLVACGVLCPINANSEIVKSHKIPFGYNTIPLDKIPMVEIYYPFSTSDINSFQAYANNDLKNYKGATISVFNLRECGFDGGDWAHPLGGTIQQKVMYRCVIDYQQRNSLGTRRCINGRISYWGRGSGSMYSGTLDFSETSDAGANCGPWEKVSTIQEPQNPLNPSTTSQTPTTQPSDIPLKDYQILGGGAVLFLLGGGFGVMLSKLMNRK